MPSGYRKTGFTSKTRRTQKNDTQKMAIAQSNLLTASLTLQLRTWSNVPKTATCLRLMTIESVSSMGGKNPVAVNRFEVYQGD